MNARKAVEPVCLDVLIKWRGDEETGRDQMDEILREVVIITDSENEDDSQDEDSLEEEGEVTSDSSTELPSKPPSRNQQRLPLRRMSSQSINSPNEKTNLGATSSRTRARDPKQKEQRGFKRYQAAWEDALNRRHESHTHSRLPYDHVDTQRTRMMLDQPAAVLRYSATDLTRPVSCFMHVCFWKD